MSPLSAIGIGALGGAVCYLSVSVIKTRFKYDDSLDAFGVHGVGGTIGALATGLFAQKAVNPAGADGLFFGNAGLLGSQAAAVGVTAAYAAAVTWLLLKILDKVMGLRVTEEDEVIGLDDTQHRESAYTLLD